MPALTRFVLLFVILFTSTTWALESSLPSSIPGITLPNSHYLTDKIVRGNSPLEYMEELTTLGITDVLIFKTPTKLRGWTKSDNEQEIELLKEMGYPSSRIMERPFRWKDIENYKLACEQVVDGLNLMNAVQKSQDRKLFFHCTVGEDRTGLLAGVYRVAFENQNPVDAFKNEMCAHGYEAGSPTKPDEVVEIIRDELTPLYLGMVKLLRAPDIDKTYLRRSICKKLKISSDYDRLTYTCERPNP